MRGSSLIIIPEGISNLSHPSPNGEGLRVRPSCILITKLNIYEHYETFANNLQAEGLGLLLSKFAVASPLISLLTGS